MTTEERIALYKTFMDKVDRPGKEEFIEWLINETDFFTAPASGRFHNNYEGGLFDHSMNVLNYARNLYVFSKKNYPDYPELSGESIIISALHHDLCKTNFYGKEKAWVKHDYTWVEYEIYKPGVVDDFAFGHGEKSVVLMLEQGFKLNRDEMLSIRYHMGPGGTIDGEKAMKNPLAFLIHMADFSASGMVEKTIDYKDKAIQEHVKKINGN